ncbi:MAG: hypothetical protein IJL05_01785 [Alphaproteobacteria bacterium]|nr:hypothetical protein [Alphaproteobacteria bacterium]
MTAVYDDKRKDITFCTMLFQIPNHQNLELLKKARRNFDDYYLQYLKQLIQTFKQVALWCDEYTADFIKENHLDKYINMRVMRFEDLPHYREKNDWLNILNKMKRYVGFLLHHKTPERWIDYLILINAKPALLDWAARTDKFKSKYFMWMDVGALNPEYSYCWENWDGSIQAKPDRVRLSIHKTVWKTRPHFIPRFIYVLYFRLRKIPFATRKTLKRQKLVNIAMINADYDVPGCCFMMPKDKVHDFYKRYEEVRLFMKEKGLVSTEQAIFQAMLKLDTDNMFELSYEKAYIGAYTVIMKKNPDNVL